MISFFCRKKTVYNLLKLQLRTVRFESYLILTLSAVAPCVRFEKIRQGAVSLANEGS